MRIQSIELPQDWEFVEVFSVCDMHIGDILFNHVEFHRFIQMVLAEPNRYLIVNGDILNNNLKNSAGSAFEDVIPPSEQKKEAKRMLSPVRHRILCMNGGNHEERSMREADQDVTEDMAESLGVPYQEDQNLVKLSVGKRPSGKPYVYTIYVTHGSGGGKKPGSILNSLEDLSKTITADVYVIGHAHKRIAHKAVTQHPDLRNNKVVEMEQLYVCTAGWLKYGGYPVRKMMRPQVRGAHPIVLSGTEKSATTII